MFIILLAHTPGNTWTLWIPARFGFSDATEIFVFCSGMASALAFGAVFSKRSWWLGTARIAFRVWQVYWAHIGVFFATALLMVAVDSTGLGIPGKVYAEWPPVVSFFTKTHEAIFGLFTLTYIPGLFDILPMYLVILAMVPVVMGLHKIGGAKAALSAVVLVWIAANLAGYARYIDKAEGTPDLNMIQQTLYWIGTQFSWINLRGSPWSDHVWFFNPFGWQLIFFTGFAFGMGWLPAPPVRRSLIILAIVVLVASLPIAWHKMYQYLTGYVPPDWGGLFLWDLRHALEPLFWKSWQGIFRYVHFLALGYLAWCAVGVGGWRLAEGWRAGTRDVSRRRMIGVVCILVMLPTIPYAYLEEIKFFSPALNMWIYENYLLIPGEQIGLAQIAHLAALLTLIWQAIGDDARNWIVRDAFLATVPVIRKVGTQSLAVFLTSIVVARFNGWMLDVLEQPEFWGERDVWTRAFVNLFGFAVLIAVAYSVSWFKRQPWRERPAPAMSNRDAGSKVPGRAGSADRAVAAE